METNAPSWSKLNRPDFDGDKDDQLYFTHSDKQSSNCGRLVPIGNAYDIILPISASRNKNRAGTNEWEKLFGIVPAKLTRTSLHTELEQTKSSVRVAAIIPATEAFSTCIETNDWLMAVNDLEVTWENVDSILCSVSSTKQVRLTLQHMVSDNKKVLLTRQPTSEDQLVTPIYSSGEIIPARADVSQPLLTVMYMTLDSAESSGTNDLLYCYPSQAKDDDNKLVAVRGMFLTLSNVMSDISSHPAKVSTVLCQGQPVHIAYTQYGRQLLIIAAPSEKVSAHHLLMVMQNSTRCLAYIFSSIHSALSHKDNRGRVDTFFTLLSQLLLHTPTSGHVDSSYYIRCELERCYDSMTTSPISIPLPEQVKINIDDALSEFEAADFGDMSDDFYDMRRSYSILGTCLFYKGYLAANHLPTEDMLDIALYASHYNILTISRHSPIGSSIIWQEVFPTRRQSLFDPLASQDNADTDAFYVETRGRYFLLVVAYRHSVMGILLEAGGCAAKAMGNPVADTFYVNQARQTLRKLETFDFGLICEAKLQTSRPPLTSLDNLQQPPGTKTTPAAASIAKGLLTKAGTTAADLMRRASTGNSKVKTRQSLELSNSVTSGFMASLVERPGADVDVQSYGSGSTPPHTPISEVTGFMRSRNMSVASTGSGDSTSSVNQLYSSGMRSVKGRLIVSSDSSGRRDIAPADVTNTANFNRQNSFMLSSGEENTLFNYMSFDSVLGVVLSPNLDELMADDSVEQTHLMCTFYNTCLSIRCLFQQSIDSQESGICVVQEHGAMFTLVPANNSKKSHSYWVIGRFFNRPIRREFYVCHHESVSESMVSLAFRTNTGVLI